jgi:polyketide synthase 12/myxalamid-type polyketide synthase MxaB
MARAGHIGKVVVRQHAPRPSERVSMRDDASYLITGGLGDLGLLVAEWMIERGARNVVLMARRPVDERTRPAVERLAQRARVEVVVGDAARRQDVDSAIAVATRDGRELRGVVLAAGMLDDGVLAQQTWERFTSVLAPKVAGSWHLHDALASTPLDFFIEFSSIASLLGSQGQSNHAAANAFLDAMAFHRRARGLAALSINWGAWAGVGAAARRNVGTRIAARGWSEFSPESGLAVLERVFDWPRAQVGVAPTDWEAYRRTFAPGQEPPFLSTLLADAKGPAATRNLGAAGQSVADRVREAAPGERRAIVEQFVRECVAKALGIDAAAAIDAARPLAALGLDSLLAVELRNTLNRRLGLDRRLPATLLFDFPSVGALTTHLYDMIVGDTPTPAAAPAPVARVDADEARIAAMTDEEAEALLLEELG